MLSCRLPGCARLPTYTMHHLPETVTAAASVASMAPSVVTEGWLCPPLKGNFVGQDGYGVSRPSMKSIDPLLELAGPVPIQAI